MNTEQKEIFDYVVNQIPELKKCFDYADAKKHGNSIRFEFGNYHISITKNLGNSGCNCYFYFYQFRKESPASSRYVDYVSKRCGEKRFFEFLDKILIEVKKEVDFIKESYKCFM